MDDIAIKHTRTDIFKDKVQIRLALDSMGIEIESILTENDIIIPNIKWDKVYPHWLIATIEDEVIGCVQVLPSRPIGFMEFLFIRPSVGVRLRTIAIRKLIYTGLATIQQGNAQYAACAIKSDNVKMQKILGNMNCVKTADAAIMVKLLSTG